jgi:hypothetical protein
VKRRADPCSFGLPARFWAKVFVDTEAGCWLWTASTDSNGYGQFVTGSRTDGSRRQWRAYRFAYEAIVGQVRHGLQLDHVCRVRRCVNPAHLEAVTSRENTLRGESPAAANATKTHCPAGHPYVGDNLRIYRGWRRCRACDRRENRSRRAK